MGSPIKPAFNRQFKIPQSKPEWKEPYCPSRNCAHFTQENTRYRVLLLNVTATETEPELSSSTINQSWWDNWIRMEGKPIQGWLDNWIRTEGKINQEFESLATVPVLRVVVGRKCCQLQLMLYQKNTSQTPKHRTEKPPDMYCVTSCSGLITHKTAYLNWYISKPPAEKAWCPEAFNAEAHSSVVIYFLSIIQQGGKSELTVSTEIGWIYQHLHSLGSHLHDFASCNL